MDTLCDDDYMDEILGPESITPLKDNQLKPSMAQLVITKPGFFLTLEVFDHRRRKLGIPKK